MGNVCAQVSDLLNNAYDLFYLKNGNVEDDKRARKLLTRCYEAASYVEMLGRDSKVVGMRERMYRAIESGSSIGQAKEIFDEFAKMYEERVVIQEH